MRRRGASGGAVQGVGIHANYALTRMLPQACGIYNPSRGEPLLLLPGCLLLARAIRTGEDVVVRIYLIPRRRR